MTKVISPARRAQYVERASRKKVVNRKGKTFLNAQMTDAHLYLSQEQANTYATNYTNYKCHEHARYVANTVNHSEFSDQTSSEATRQTRSKANGNSKSNPENQVVRDFAVGPGCSANPPSESCNYNSHYQAQHPNSCSHCWACDK